jgi:hypothetical protein
MFSNPSSVINNIYSVLPGVPWSFPEILVFVFMGLGVAIGVLALVKKWGKARYPIILIVGILFFSSGMVLNIIENHSTVYGLNTTYVQKQIQEKYNMNIGLCIMGGSTNADMLPIETRTNPESVDESQLSVCTEYVNKDKRLGILRSKNSIVVVNVDPNDFSKYTVAKKIKN